MNRENFFKIVKTIFTLEAFCEVPMPPMGLKNNKRRRLFSLENEIDWEINSRVFHDFEFLFPETHKKIAENRIKLKLAQIICCFTPSEVVNEC